MDPMNEYIPHKDYYGLDGIMITGTEELGLDPFKIMSPKEAASILKVVTNSGNKPEIYNEFFKYADQVKSIFELYDKCSPRAREYLEGFVSGPLATTMRGEVRMSDNIIIAMKAQTRTICLTH